MYCIKNKKGDITTAKRYTLRHAAGAPMYTTKTAKIQIRNTRELDDNIRVGDIFFKPKKSQKNKNPTFKLMPQ